MAQSTGNEGHVVRIHELRRCVIEACLQLAVPRQDAAQVAEVLVDSELRGHDSHGVHLLGFLIDSYQQHGLNPRPRVRVLRETDSTLLLDGDHSCVVAAMQAMRWCMARARQRPGLALAGVRHSQLIVPGYYARLAAAAGLIGFACTNTPPFVAPPGGRTPTLGTNPFAYGLPAGHHPPVVLDMATTAGAAFTVRLAARRGHQMPEGMLLDHAGQPSTEPNDFLAGGLLAPLGFPLAPHKGFGLALLIDSVAGILTGAAFARDVAAPAATGNLLGALDVEAFLPRQEFLDGMDAQIAHIKAGARTAGADELLVPGERGQRRHDQLVARGTVPLSAGTWDSVRRACATLAVALPDVLEAE
jgi:LDH2 family malate/lactate/ureidoglycolate dehydrogenase